jgi:hypothetical protein
MATPLATGLESIVPGDGSASAKLRQQGGLLRRFVGSVGSHVANCREFRADPCRCVAPDRVASLLLQTVRTPRGVQSTSGRLSPVVAAPAKADSGGEPPPSVIAAPFGSSREFADFLLFSYRERKIRVEYRAVLLTTWGGS